MKPKINWNALISELLIIIGLFSAIPYAQGNFLPGLIPVSWIPWLARIGVGAGTFIRLWPHIAVALNSIFGINLPTTVPAVASTSTQPQAGAIQPTIQKAT